ncbi:hypothetical protein WJ972_10650 [Achromobacter insuavis]
MPRLDLDRAFVYGHPHAVALDLDAVARAQRQHAAVVGGHREGRPAASAPWPVATYSSPRRNARRRAPALYCTSTALSLLRVKRVPSSSTTSRRSPTAVR